MVDRVSNVKRVVLTPRVFPTTGSPVEMVVSEKLAKLSRIVGIRVMISASIQVANGTTAVSDTELLNNLDIKSDGQDRISGFWQNVHDIVAYSASRQARIGEPTSISKVYNPLNIAASAAAGSVSSGYYEFLTDFNANEVEISISTLSSSLVPTYTLTIVLTISDGESENLVIKGNIANSQATFVTEEADEFVVYDPNLTTDIAAIGVDGAKLSGAVLTPYLEQGNSIMTGTFSVPSSYFVYTGTPSKLVATFNSAPAIANYLTIKRQFPLPSSVSSITARTVEVSPTTGPSSSSTGNGSGNTVVLGNRRYTVHHVNGPTGPMTLLKSVGPYPSLHAIVPVNGGYAVQKIKIPFFRRWQL